MLPDLSTLKTLDSLALQLQVGISRMTDMIRAG